MSARTKTVVSVLLSDPPTALVASAARTVDPDYAESLRLGLTESLAAWDARQPKAGR